MFYSEPSSNIDKYEEKTVELIGWGSKTKAGSTSDWLKRISLTVLPMR